MSRSVRAYRNSATEGATHIDILLACYDTLAEDLRLAGECRGEGLDRYTMPLLSARAALNRPFGELGFSAR